MLQTLILQGVSSHINDGGKKAESLRSKFVTHEGRMVLEISRDNFVLGKAGNDWEGVVAEFNQQISSNVVPGAAKVCVCLCLCVYVHVYVYGVCRTHFPLPWSKLKSPYTTVMAPTTARFTPGVRGRVRLLFWSNTTP